MDALHASGMSLDQRAQLNFDQNSIEDNEANKKLTGEEDCKAQIVAIEEMIQFMDFSFERAFQQKDKEFMIAYREHIKAIQIEIDQLKADSNDQRFMELKNQKIKTLETKLSQIRKQALFLGDMSEMHQKAIKEKKLEVDEEEREKIFLKEQIQKVKLESRKIKLKLQKVSEEYDELYTQAQDFLQTCDDKDKVQELLKILEQTDAERKSLMQEDALKEKQLQKAIEMEPNAVQQQAHLGRGIVKSLKKYENMKLQRFIEHLYLQEVSNE